MICRLTRIGAVFAVLVELTAGARADDLMGQASVIDGNTPDIHTVIGAPDKQPGSRRSH
jgi:hypothetical protein